MINSTTRTYCLAALSLNGHTSRFHPSNEQLKPPWTWKKKKTVSQECSARLPSFPRSHLTGLLIRPSSSRKFYPQRNVNTAKLVHKYFTAVAKFSTSVFINYRIAYFKYKVFILFPVYLVICFITLPRTFPNGIKILLEDYSMWLDFVHLKAFVNSKLKEFVNNNLGVPVYIYWPETFSKTWVEGCYHKSYFGCLDQTCTLFK